MLLGTKNITQGDKRRIRVEYDAWLSDDMTLTSTVVTCADPTVTISGAQVASDRRTVLFYVAGGVLNFMFTVSIQVVNSRTEIKNDTMNFAVVAP